MNPICEAVEQITVFLENRPGILADLCAHLSDHRINLRAIAVVDTADIGAARMVVDNPAEAKQTLSAAGVEFSSTHVLAVEMPNDPGAFARIAHNLAVAGINIDYIYASGLKEHNKALGIFHVADLEKALTLEWKA